VTVGVLGAFTGVRLSLELSSLALLVFSIALFARDARESRQASPVLVDRESV
jgi:hypothetical protein